MSGFGTNELSGSGAAIPAHHPRHLVHRRAAMRNLAHPLVQQTIQSLGLVAVNVAPESPRVSLPK